MYIAGKKGNTYLLATNWHTHSYLLRPNFLMHDRED